MRRLRTFSYSSELRQFDSLFSHQRPSHGRMLRCAGSLASNAQAVSDFEPCIFGIHGLAGPTFRAVHPNGFPGLQTDPDRQHRRVRRLAIANSSKKNGMRAIGRAFPSLARLLLRYPQKKRQLKNRRREGTFRCQPVFNSSPSAPGDIACVALRVSARMRTAMNVDA